MRIEGCHALVTGAASGIGLATCRMLLAGGAARVGFLDCSEERLQAAVAGGTSSVPLCADLRDATQTQRAVREFTAAGPLHVLVNAAGVLLDGAVASASFRGMKQYPVELWDATLDVNLKGAFLVTREAVPAMMAAKPAGGVVVSLSSISRAGRAGQAAYSASKGGLVSFAATLAQELSPYRIRSVAIAPGLVDTPMAARIPEAHREEMLKRVAARRMGRPEEIAHAVRFCIENEYFNGRVLEVDGGAY